MATEDLEVIVNRICEYTRKLAQDNQVDLTRDEMHAGDKVVSSIFRKMVCRVWHE